MNYSERFLEVSVLGAAGKMGSGICLLTAIEMTDLSLLPENQDKTFVMNAFDVSHTALNGLMRYLKVQTRKIAEKKVVQLRGVYAHRADLIENEQIIAQYIDDVLMVVKPTVCIEATYQSNIVFEAIKENPELKVQIFRKIDSNNPKKAWFFTNTSSIPIGKLDTDAQLGGRVLGVHFYNPPVVQKLVEIIKSEHTLPQLEEFVNMFVKNLRKTVVPSNDFAGFIGNGHFMRDALHGIHEAEKLTQQMPLHEAIYCINKVSNDLLIRPMGIFQLVDYVGIDVCQYIMSVMNPYLPNENLHSPLLDTMLELGVRGGQNADGSQKNGFLKYERGKAIAVFDVETKNYIDFSTFSAKADAYLGAQPKKIKAWKEIIGNKDNTVFFTEYFEELRNTSSTGAQLAVNYGKRSCEIGKQLVAQNVAHSEKDVNTVMLTGFFHAYSPINEYF